MPKYSFENIRIVFAVENRDVRIQASSMLRQIGYQKIVELSTFDRLEETLATEEIDLLICDAFMGDHNVLKLISKVRHNELGSNPYFTTILLSDDTATRSIEKIIDCGTDDILIKPINPKVLVSRIQGLIENRRGFVVTCDYVGPTRRTTHRDGSQKIPVIKVPNALRHMAEGKSNRATLRVNIHACSQEVNAQKMERHAYQIQFLANLIKPICLDENQQNFDAVPYYGRLLYFARDLKRRIHATPMQHAEVLCDSIIEVTNKLTKNPASPDNKDILQLEKMAKAANQTFAKSRELA